MAAAHSPKAGVEKGLGLPKAGVELAAPKAGVLAGAPNGLAAGVPALNPNPAGLACSGSKGDKTPAGA